MTLADLSAFVAAHGLLLLLPLAVIEGPIVSLLAGMLCSQGILDWYLVLPLLVLGDLVGDMICYGAGRFSTGWLHSLAVRLRLPLQVGADLIERVSGHATRMLLIGKWTHAIGALVLVASGIARVPVWQFLAVNTLATLPKSALLLGLGIWAGGHVVALFARFGVLVPVLLVTGVLGVIVLLRRPVHDHAA
jgi:membrane protein DedA with SNARE-associated domain